MNSAPTDYDEELSEDSATSGRLHQVVLIVAALAVVFVGALLIGRKTAPNPSPNQSLISAPQSAENPIIVDVDGRVKNPGVYELPFGTRVYQAIEAAGGALNDADLSKLNRADWVEDGSKIFIPAKNTEKTPSSVSAPSITVDNPTFADMEFPAIETENSGNLSAESSAEKPSQSAPTQKISPPKPASKDAPKAAPKKKDLPTQPIDINRATAEQLQQLPGIGPAMAQRILQYRKEINGFTQPDDLLDVRGIGEKTMQKLSPHIIVKPLPHQDLKTE